ncbi:TRAP transporter large permease [Desulfomonile tiedjei]|uniref:TRAP transporter, DctM subunit n=1 Tax=Desulfomonile tiedjei (strain ATCC 49306 / DSM 6799 / DCB-1) TaxID=706587 RepID=I4C5S8_DESTA|nr:TRAP transporter large permease subunit [Desulfomonile tiedjei]AFM24919.1 TRAP transporter, DctM subunit [Desulfomonile tiedjei DSM 6799]
MSPEFVAVAMFGTLFVVLFMGHPLAFSLGAVAVLFGLLGWGGSPDQIFGIFANKTYGVMEEYVLVAVPLFIFMAQMLDASGVAEKLFHTMHVLWGPVRGGLGIAVILVCTVFAASTGVVGATEVAIGLLAAPNLLKRGYDIPMTAGCICAGGTLGILIPPSIMLVVYGGLTNISVGKLFAAAMLPGLTLSSLYIIYVAVRCGLNPKMGPPLPKEERTQSAKQKLGMVFTSLIPPLFLIFMVLGSIVAGIATTTEAAGLGAIGAMLLALAYRRLTWAAIVDSATATMKITCMVMVLFLGGNAFQSIFMGLGGGDAVSSVLLGLQVSPYVVLFIMMGIVFFLGMFIDWLGILLIVIPVFTPVAQELGFDPLWFGTLICVNLQMAFLTPPFGYSLFYLRGIAPPEMTMGLIYKGVIPFICLQWIGLIACVMYQPLIMYLPTALFGE